MKEYIERAVVKEKILSWAVCINHPELLSKEDTMHCINSLPAADVVEVRHARWNNWGYEPLWQECSACNYRIQYSYSKDCKFCPNCGARMDKEDEHEVSE